MINHFVIVDDDALNNMICRKIIVRAFPYASVQTFTDPELGLSYIQSGFTQPHAPDAILFLDINMPAISGWEFLDFFEQFDEKIKERVKIYILSSSVDFVDKERAAGNKNVLEYIEKPLSIEWLENIFSPCRKN